MFLYQNFIKEVGVLNQCRFFLEFAKTQKRKENESANKCGKSKEKCM